MILSSWVSHVINSVDRIRVPMKRFKVSAKSTMVFLSQSYVFPSQYRYYALGRLLSLHFVVDNF